MAIYNLFNKINFSGTSIQKKQFFLSFFLILTLGFFLRVHNLGLFSLWFDEASSVWGSEYILKAIKMHPFLRIGYSPLFILLLRFWRQLIGESEFILRMLPLVFNMISIIAIYKVGQLFFNRKVGLSSAFFLAISPFHIYYSQEVRMYTLMVLLTLLSVFCLIKALRNKSYIFWLGYAIFNILNIYTHLAMILFLSAQIGYFLFYWKRYKTEFRKWIKIHLLIAVLLIPWLMNIFWGVSKVEFNVDIPYFHNKIAWIPKVSWITLYLTFKNFSIGYNAAKPVNILTTAIFLLLFIYGLFSKGKREELSISVFCIFIPILLAFIISKFKVCYLDRYFIPGSTFFYIIVAYGLSRIVKKYAIPLVVLILILAGFSLKNYYNNYLSGSFSEHIGIEAKKEHRAAAAYIRENIQEGDAIFHTSENTVLPFEYYLNLEKRGLFIKPDYFSNIKQEQIFLVFDKTKGELSPYVHIKNKGGICDQFIKSQDISVTLYKRFWLVFSSWLFEGLNQPEISYELAPKLALLDFMDKHYKRIDEKRFNGIIIYLYSQS
jgi:uncharacterized membrane protein